MIQIAIRSKKDNVGTLAVRIVNRKMAINSYVSLHLKIKVKDWLDEAQLPKNCFDERPVKELDGMSYAQLTQILQDLKKVLQPLDENNSISITHARTLINTIVSQHKMVDYIQAEATPVPKGKPTFMEFVSQFIEECEKGERLKQKSTKKVSPGTIKNYKGFLTQMLEYQKSRKRIVDWDDLNLDFYRDYKQFFIEKDYSPNTIARHIKSMKTMLYAAKDMHYTTRDDFTSRQWSADREDVENIYIPQDRLKEMYEFDLSDYTALKVCADKYAKDDAERMTLIRSLQRKHYRKKLAEARDIFLMGCLTGQRVSDYKRITKDMIETIQGDRKFIHLVQVKTEKEVYVPYDSRMTAILDKYDGQLPCMYEQDLNDRIKVVGLLLGWTESAGLTERRGVMTYASKKRFCDALVTHTARRTFATNAYKAGVPLSAIMAVTGHASEDMLRRYLKLNSKERALLAAEAFDKVRSVG